MAGTESAESEWDRTSWVGAARSSSSLQWMHQFTRRSSRRRLGELSRVFPEATVPPASLPLGGLACDEDANAMGPMSAAEFLTEHVRRRRVLASSHAWVSVAIAQFLKVSALVSAACVPGFVAVEPECVPPAAGAPWQRVGGGGGGHRSVEALLMYCHAVNAVAYAVLSMASRPLLGRADLARGVELVSVADVLRSQVTSPGLWLDMLSLVGLVGELLHFAEAPLVAGVPSTAQWLSLMQLGKLWRVTLPEAEANSRETGRLTFVVGAAGLLFSMAFFAHAYACVLLALGTQERNWGRPSWTLDSVRFGSGGDSDRAGCAELYVEAFYFAALSLTSVGYSDFLKTPLERGVNSFFLLISALYCAKVCADLTWLTSTHHHWEAKQQALQAQTWASLQNMHVPKHLAERVLAFQRYVATVHREDLSQPMFSALSPNLIQELRLYAYRKLVLQAVFLREQPKEIIALIVGALTDQVYLPSDFILRRGQKGRELYFVRRGCAEVYIGSDPPSWGASEPVAMYGVGNYFGELAMLTGRPRAAWVMATTYCVCSVLPYEAVERLGREHPSAFTRIVQSMIQVYKLKASLRWEEVITRMAARYHFGTPEEAFGWLCAQEGDEDREELTARAFDEGMRKLKVPQLDRTIFWAKMDKDRRGEITLEDFYDRVPPESFNSPPTRQLPRWQTEPANYSLDSITADMMCTPSSLNSRQAAMARAENRWKALAVARGTRRAQDLAVTHISTTVGMNSPLARSMTELSAATSQAPDDLEALLNELAVASERVKLASHAIREHFSCTHQQPVSPVAHAPADVARDS